LAERSQINRCVPGRPDGRRRVTATATTTFIPNVNVVISYRLVKSRPSSHRLCPVTWLKQAGYGKKSHHSCGSTFSRNRPARAGYVKAWVKAQGCRVQTFPKISGQMLPSISSEALILGIGPP